MHKFMTNTMSKESTVYTSPIQKLWSMDNVSVCRIFSQCFLYVLIYLHVQIFNAVFPIERNL